MVVDADLLAERVTDEVLLAERVTDEDLDTDAEGVAERVAVDVRDAVAERE